MGPAGGFARGHYMPHDYNQPFRNRLATGSFYMDPEEIDSILRIQWKSLHSGSPYVEDYYYLVGQHTLLQPSGFTYAKPFTFPYHKIVMQAALERTL